MSARFAIATILTASLICPNLSYGTGKHLKTNTGVVTLTLERNEPEDGVIFGDLYVDGRWQCKTLESAKFLIPTGHYRGVLYHSPKFETWVPLIFVPGRTNIEIHIGYANSKGCILISDYAFAQLMRQLKGPFVVNIS